MIKANFIFLLVFLPAFSFTQSLTNRDSFSYFITAVKGDLNNDNLVDSAVVVQDTLANTQPFRLKIYFKNHQGKYQLVLQSDSAIEARYPDGRSGYINATLFLGITIKRGILTISEELTRGHYEHKFRYRDGHFELIGFTQVYSDGQGIMYTTDYNLSTGVLLEISERYDTNKVLSKETKTIKVKVLPDLRTFIPHSTDIY